MITWAIPGMTRPTATAGIPVTVTAPERCRPRQGALLSAAQALQRRCRPLPDADHLTAGRAQLRAHARRGCDAAVGDVDRAVASRGEAGREEQLAGTQVGAVAVLADPHDVACRVRGRALVQPAGLEFGGVEGPVLAE